MNTKNIFMSIVAVASIAAVATSTPLRKAITALNEQSHAANEAQIVAKSEAKQEAIEGLNIHGMETNTVGFHMVQPPRTHLPTSGIAFGEKDTAWDWWLVETAYPETTTDSYGIQASSVLASVLPVFPNPVATLGKFQSSGGWGINATFSTRGLNLISAVHGPVSSGGDFTDWYGVFHSGGGTASQMNAALITSSRSLLPFNVTSLVGLSGPQTVVVARDLTEAEVDLIIEQF